MPLITDGYRDLNRRAHLAADGYGVQGYKYLQPILALAERVGAQSILDYGCGQGTLAAYAKRMSPLPVHNYDPAIPEWAGEPSPADVVVCTDVLEHIEPLCLPEVMEHLAFLTNKAAYFIIACRPAKRVLDDGRNAHLIVREPAFWFNTLSEHFDVVEFKATRGVYCFAIVEPKGD